MSMTATVYLIFKKIYRFKSTVKLCGRVLWRSHKNDMRYLGLDYGLKKIGLAIGDDKSKIASPLEVIKVINVIAVIENIKDLIAEEGIEAIVVGVPKKVGDFHSGGQLDLTKKFIDNLRLRTG